MMKKCVVVVVMAMLSVGVMTSCAVKQPKLFIRNYIVEATVGEIDISTAFFVSSTESYEVRVTLGDREERGTVIEIREAGEYAVGVKLYVGGALEEEEEILVVASEQEEETARQLLTPRVVVVGQILVWQEVLGATSYRVYINGEVTREDKSTTYSLEELGVGEYTIAIMSVGDGITYLDSSLSSGIKYAVQPEELLAPQISIVGNIISWSEVRNATGYDIYRDNKLVGQTTATQYIGSSAALGSYSYSVVATSSTASYTNSKASNKVVYVAMDTTPPKATVGAASINAVRFETVDLIAACGVEISDDYTAAEDISWQVKFCEKMIEGASITPKDSGEFVASITASDESGNSVVISINVVVTNSALAQPNAWLASATEIVWDSVPNADSYIVTVSGGSDSDAAETIVTECRYILTDVKPGKYSVKVRAVCSLNNYDESIDSNEVSIEIATQPEKTPLPPVIELRERGIYWDSVEYADSYGVYVNGERVAIVAGTSYALPHGGDCSVYVTSILASYESVASNIVNYIVPLPQPPVIGLRENGIYWDSVEYAESYGVYVNGERVAIVAGTSYALPLGGDCSVYVTSILASYESVASNVVNYIVPLPEPKPEPPTITVERSYIDIWRYIQVDILTECGVTISSNQAVTTSLLCLEQDMLINGGKVVFNVSGRYVITIVAVDVLGGQSNVEIMVNVRNTQLSPPNIYKSASGAVWDSVRYADIYTVYIDGEKYCDTQNTAIDLSNLAVGSYRITVVAWHLQGYYDSSGQSNEIEYDQVPKPLHCPQPQVVGAMLKWQAVAHADRYIVYIDSQQYGVTAGQEMPLPQTNQGKHTAQVEAVSDSDDWLRSGKSAEVEFTVASDNASILLTTRQDSCAVATGERVDIISAYGVTSSGGQGELTLVAYAENNKLLIDGGSVTALAVGSYTLEVYVTDSVGGKSARAQLKLVATLAVREISVIANVFENQQNCATISSNNGYVPGECIKASDFGGGFKNLRLSIGEDIPQSDIASKTLTFYVYFSGDNQAMKLALCNGATQISKPITLDTANYLKPCSQTNWFEVTLPLASLTLSSQGDINVLKFYYIPKSPNDFLSLDQLFVN